MYSIDEQFRAALKEALSKRGVQYRLSIQTGIQQAQISRIMKAKNRGSEPTRRKIASALGYSYEDFLERGRAILADQSPDRKADSDNLPTPVVLLDKWIADLLPLLESLDIHGQKAVKALVTGLTKE
jgi:transcriptional regulator with XRE-family HTH domain